MTADGSSEQVRWTQAGKAALAEAAGSTHRDTPEAELRALVVAAAKKGAPMWKRGLAHADDEGKAAVVLADAILPKGKLPKRLSVDDAARLLSLAGAASDDDCGPLGELMLRQYGLDFIVAAVARMWSHVSRSKNPDWPKSERRAAIYVCAVADDDDHVHDSSCSYSKSSFSLYLARRYRGGTAAERTAMRKGVTAIFKSTTPHARPALAYITNDPKRAKESAEELIHAGESPWPFWAWDHLPYVITDAELAIRILRDNALSEQLIENLGNAIWSTYAERIASRISGHARAELLRQLTNFYGPQTALLIAEYEDTKDCVLIVRDYFTLYPELLDKVIDEPELKYHRDDLVKLRDDILAQARPRSSRTSSRSDTSIPSRRTSPRTT